MKTLPILFAVFTLFPALSFAETYEECVARAMAEAAADQRDAFDRVGPNPSAAEFEMIVGFIQDRAAADLRRCKNKRDAELSEVIAELTAHL